VVLGKLSLREDVLVETKDGVKERGSLRGGSLGDHTMGGGVSGGEGGGSGVVVGLEVGIAGMYSLGDNIGGGGGFGMGSWSLNTCVGRRGGGGTSNGTGGVVESIACATVSLRVSVSEVSGGASSLMMYWYVESPKRCCH